ncbi:hypothetical protein TanjilG_28834 [Lupinus angustifolius]|uniref:Transcription factor CBF/NF-Y/archaeal histone domain-containing protein n=1 Tax=Lupinus angustifolius TaxID=3871 RepID=A0A4P1R8Z1_LUPAN|nr:PREDICTED: nuclear transcription factor Y subunit B-10-like [Lupinus angustifolius]OIW05369.1 hypothetical protein TanjilG_28834 [Lupinus angustifolius]
MTSPNYGTREHEQYMPIANVTRIMRRILPSHAKISDEAKETVQQCVSEFISFVTAEANDRCQREQRKTVTAEDLLFAMEKLGFDDYVEPLSLYLQRYRENEAEPISATRVVNYGSHSLPPQQQLAGAVSYASHSLPPLPPQPLAGGGSYGSHSLPPPPQPLAGGGSYGSHSLPPPPQPLAGGGSYGSHSLPPPPQPLASGGSYGSGFTAPAVGMFDPSASTSGMSGSGNYSIAAFDNMKRDRM